MKKTRIIACVFVVLIFIGYVNSCEPILRSTLEKEFASEFGFKPSANLTDIKSRTVQVGDSWARWIRFNYESNTLARIVSSGFVLATDEMLNDGDITVWESDLKYQSSPNAPKWWEKPTNIVGAVYVKDKPYIEGSNPNTMPSYHLVWADQARGFVYSERHVWQ